MRTRFIVLGASNLAISFPWLHSRLIQAAGSGMEMWGAFGHGRSYGLPTRVLGRGLPSITGCGLWAALETRDLETRTPPAQTHALVADVGNDLLFGPDVETVAGWVEACVEKLADLGAGITILGLPLAAIESLPPARFLFFRTLLYPGCKKPWQQIRNEAQRLDAALRDLAQRHGAHFQEPLPEWYGLDPVHIRPRALTTAWEKVMEGWPGPSRGSSTKHLAPRKASRISWRRRLRLWVLPPEERTVWGQPRRTPQPVVEDQEGNAVYLY